MKKPVRPNQKPTKTTKMAKVGRIRVARGSARPAARVQNRKTAKVSIGILRDRLKRQNLSNVVAFKSRPREARIIMISLLAAFAALVLLVFATMFTPLLAVEKIRISGLSKITPAQVEKAVQSQVGTPLPLVSYDSVAQALSKFTLIESFTLVSELPNTLHIAISERQPICVVDIKGVSYLYDPAGIRLGEASYKDKFPRVLIVGEPKGNQSFEQAIDVLLALPADLLPRLSQIDAKSKDDVTMQLRGNAGQRIIWGDSSQSTLKSKVLAALIENQKPTDRVTFDVSSPAAPVVRYR